MEKLLAIVIDAAKTGIPSGHLYAILMTIGISLEQYNTLIALLVEMNYITEQHHYLTATETGIAFAARNA